MTQRRLTDSELATRVRASNVRRAERRRVKLSDAGHVQTVVWLTADTRHRLEAESAATGQTLSKTVDRLLAAALATKVQHAVLREPPAIQDPAPFSPTGELPPPIDTKLGADPLLSEIARLVAQGKSWQAIADDLNARGFKTPAGARFHKGALHRFWLKQQERQP